MWRGRSGSGGGGGGVWRAGGVAGRGGKVPRGPHPPARTRKAGAGARAGAVWPQADLMGGAGEDATLRAVTADGAAGEQSMPAGVDWIRAAIIRADGSVIAGCEDGGIRIWEGSGLVSVSQGSDTTWAAAFAGDHALLGRANGTVEMRDMASSELITATSAGEGRVWSLAASADRMAAACGDGTVRVWSLRGDWTLELNEDEQRSWTVALSQDGTRLAASSAGNIVRTWELPSGEKLWECHAHEGRIRSVAFDDSGGLLLTGGGDGLARLRRLPAGDQAGEVRHGAR